MMKPAIVLLVLVAAAMAVPRTKRQIFWEIDPAKVPEIMNNSAIVDTHVKCVLASDAEAATICDRIGKIHREIIPIAIEKGDCPRACNTRDKKAIAYIFKVLMEKYPDHWAKLTAHYKVTPQKLKQLQDWIKTVGPL